MSTYVVTEHAPKERIRVVPKEMHWGVDQGAEIIVPFDIPFVNGGFQDIVEWITANYPDINTRRYWRMALEGTHYQYFYTPHNKRICWRNRACYDAHYVWQARRRASQIKRPSVWRRIADVFKS